MALDSVSVSEQVVSGKERINSPQKKEPKSQGDANPTSPAKRNKCPGIRVVGGRIYDSVNGKTCHQCRQKTRDFAASCTNQRNNKPCTLMLCHKCLLNRYGEKAEEVSARGEWTCPKCRGICNCSVCMKKRGHQPTGILITTAKATGFSSVSEMLLKGAEQFNSGNVVDDLVATPKKGGVVSPRKRGKENSFDGNVDANLPDTVDKNMKTSKTEGGRQKKKIKQEMVKGIADLKRNVGETEEIGVHNLAKKSKKMKLADSLEMDNGNKDDMLDIGVHRNQKKPKKTKSMGLEEKDNAKKDDDILVRRTSPRKSKNPDKMSAEKSKLTIGVNSGEKMTSNSSIKLKPVGLEEKDNARKNDITLAKRTSPRKLKNPDKMSMEEPKLSIGVYSEAKMKSNNSIIDDNPPQPLENNVRKYDSSDRNYENVLKHHNINFEAAFPLPLGTELTSVAGIDVCVKDVGNALQFIEFFAVFGEVLGINKGRPENVLRDLLHGRTGRRGKFSATVQFQMDLLNIILREEGKENVTLSPGKNFWFNVLKKILSASQKILITEGVDVEKTADYETLDASVKLRLLNLLCDEILAKEMMREWIEDENTKFVENIKAAKQKVQAAKDKEKNLKQRLKDDIAKAIIAKQGATLSISEHEAIVARIKSETEKAHAEVLESKGMLMKDTQLCDAVRIEPIFMGNLGHAYWKLNHSGKSDVLRQDIGKGDNTLTLDEKWFIIDVEGKNAIEKHISSFRGKRLRASKVADIAQS